MTQRLIEELEEIKRQENFPDLGRSFVFWVLKNFYDLDEETAASKIVESPNDKRVDALLEEDGSVKILQCKCFKSPKEVTESEIVLFKGCIDWLKNPDEVKKLNLDRLYDASLTFTERWNEGADVELHFFALGEFSPNARHERIVFNKVDARIQMYFHDYKDILNYYEARSLEENPLAEERIEFELTPREYFIREGRVRSIVATIKGKDLLRIYDKYGDALFERNIRLYRGSRKGSINERIIDTILDEDERKNFWYYNNGISFICSEFILHESAAQPKLEIKGFQIINGCQTTACLREAKERASLTDIPNEVQIVIRFIKAPPKEVDLITLYTNSQNPVSGIQLKSNDPLQKRLKQQLGQFSPPFFYSIKEGDWGKLVYDEKKKFEGNIIEMSAAAAQAIYSFLDDPAFARRYKIRLFTEKYSEIFKKDITSEEIILPWLILKIINNSIAEYRREEFSNIKKEPPRFNEDQLSDIKKKEFLLYSNLIMLHFMGRLMKQHYGQYSSIIASKLLNKQLEGRVKKLFDYIVGVLKFSEKLQKETNIPRFLKNIDNISSLYDEVQKQLSVDEARFGNDPLDDFLLQIKS